MIELIRDLLIIFLPLIGLFERIIDLGNSGEHFENELVNKVSVDIIQVIVTAPLQLLQHLIILA